MKNIRLEIDHGGIGVATLDMPGKAFNVFSEDMMNDFEQLLAAAQSGLKGLVITSGKSAFIAGADLGMVKDFANMRFYSTNEAMRERFSGLGRLFRRVERLKIPVVAAINGLALGGGLELVMACHARICVDTPAAILGLPEILLGLLPGAGGTQRLPRYIGPEAAVKMLLSGESTTPDDALRLGLVDEVVTLDQLLMRAKARVIDMQAGARWDRGDWHIDEDRLMPLTGEDGYQSCLQLGGWHNRQHHLYPAVDAIIRCVQQGYPLSIDAGCNVEWDIFVSLMRDPVVANMIATCFLNKTAASKAAINAVNGEHPEAAAVSVWVGSGRGVLERMLGVLTTMMQRDTKSPAEFAAAAAAVELSITAPWVQPVLPVVRPEEITATSYATGINMLAAMALEAWQCVVEGVIDSIEQLDVLAVYALGFPKWTGGPIAFLAMLQRHELDIRLLSVTAQHALAAIGRPMKIAANYNDAATIAAGSQ